MTTTEVDVYTYALTRNHLTIAITGLYNKRPGRRILVSDRTFRGKPRPPKATT